MPDLFSAPFDALPAGSEYVVTLSDGRVLRGPTLVVRGQGGAFVDLSGDGVVTVEIDGQTVTPTGSLTFDVAIAVTEEPPPPPPGTPPSFTTNPSVPSGAPTVGVEVTGTAGVVAGDAPITVTRQWYRGASTLITGATSLPYTPQTADEGATLKMRESATNAAGGPVTADSNNTGVVVAAPPPPPPPPPPPGSVSYIAPAARGDGSGSSKANAAAFTSLPGLIAPDRTIFLLADEGPYTMGPPIIIAAGGSADDHRCRIQGVDTNGNAMKAMLVGNRTTRELTRWTPPTDPAQHTPAPFGGTQGSMGATVWTMAAGADWITFADIFMDHVANGWAQNGADNTGITLEDIDALFVRALWDQTTNRLTGRHDFIARRIDVDGFSKQCFDIKGTSSNHVYEDMVLNSHRVDRDNFAVGLAVGFRESDGTNNPVRDILVRRSWMGRCTDTTNDTGYWNADGIATERGVTNLVVEDSIFEGHTDGGIDDKSDSIYRRCTFRDSKRNARVWAASRLEDCQFIDAHKNPPDWGGSGSIRHVYGYSATCNALIIGGQMVGMQGVEADTDVGQGPARLTFQGVSGMTGQPQAVGHGSIITVT